MENLEEEFGVELFIISHFIWSSQLNITIIPVNIIKESNVTWTQISGIKSMDGFTN